MNNESDLSVYVKNRAFEFPDDRTIEQMDLIDLRRKIMKWCAKSNGAIGPCRACKSKCKAGERALILYDGIDAPEASEPEVSVMTVKSETNNETTKEEPEKKMRKKRTVVKCLSTWYTDAKASGDPVKWCMTNLGLTMPQAKKRIYMYEYNRGIRRTTQEVASEATDNTAVNADQPQTACVASGTLIDAMTAEMQMLVEKQKEYKAQLDELTEKSKRIADRIEAITMCIELYKDKGV